MTTPARRITPHQRAVLEALRRGPLKAREIADYIYRDDIDGGPDSESVAVRMIIYRIRAAGIRIENTACRGSVGYRLMPEHIPDVDAMLAEAPRG